MPDTDPVDFVLELPAELAGPAEDLRRRDPDYLRTVLRYGIVRRAIYDELERATTAAPEGRAALV
ncbi:MAG: hypothetical protein ACE5HF_07035 [Gemmatimonadota bacterium]